eukprot:TRINITY_DN73_c0_g3_i4.p1 TRINITY_DN73_c0_g3~~TRINITY_DN73_c0_g3_i4.p1  ORF type:complete len:394 (+),score=136.85 TRINITY_DN73_c0_g3_i4:260-1441(+)
MATATASPTNAPDVPDLFPEYFEIFCLAITFTIGLQVTFFFGERWLTMRRNMMNATGFLAAIIAAVYTLVKALHLFSGIGLSECNALRISLGLGQGLSNGFAFLHLFLRADAINAINPKWPPWRAVGIVLTVTNWVCFLAVSFLRKGEAKDQFGAERCVFYFEEISSNFKWVLQLINHVLFSLFFAWPLVKHMRAMERANMDTVAGTVARSGFFSALLYLLRRHRTSSRGVAVYERLVRRAVVPMVVSSVFTLVVTILNVIDFQVPHLNIPITSLSILDNGLTLGSICFANGGATAAYERARVAGNAAPNPRQVLSSDGAHVSLGDQETWPGLQADGMRTQDITEASQASASSGTAARCPKCGIVPNFSRARSALAPVSSPDALLADDSDETA